ncbi:MAG: hypothetical protein E7571_05170 [Ruminococcaceae bacterium]|nr:hypothetical protein [Oscillospiraceae bacterium]
MDDFFDLLNKIKRYAAYPVIFTSVAVFFAHIISLFNLEGTERLSADIRSAAGVLFGAAVCAVTAYYSCRSFKKSLAAAFSLLCGDYVLYSAAEVHFSLVFCVFLAAVFWLILTNSDFFYGFLLCFSVSVLIAVAAVMFYPQYSEILKSFAERISGRGAVFGTLSNVFNLLFGSTFDSLFYYKSYSATTVVSGRIITGALDIFNTASSPQPSAAEFLSGRYFASIFIPLGMFAAIFKRLEKETLFAFLFTLTVSLTFGDERLFYLLLLLVSPLLYVGSLILIFAAYTVCNFVDIRIGFFEFPTLYGLIANMDKPLYFLSVGVVITLLAYFWCRLICEKFRLLENSDIPPSVRKLVNTLGGSRNILTIENGCVVVSNPNLIDILHLDCEIHENRVSLLQDDFNLLRKFVE